MNVGLPTRNFFVHNVLNTIPFFKTALLKINKNCQKQETVLNNSNIKLKVNVLKENSKNNKNMKKLQSIYFTINLLTAVKPKIEIETKCYGNNERLSVKFNE